MKHVEEAEFVVRMTLTTTMVFSPIERDRPLTRQDAIDNAYGSLPEEWFKHIEGEGWSVEFEAERV